MNIREGITKKAMLNGLSTQTIKTYVNVVETFLQKYKKNPFEVTKNDIEKHCLMLLERGSPGNTINVHLNALKFFYEEVLNRKLTVNVRYLKVPQRLPEFLTQEEVKRLLNNISNEKHLLMIIVMYSSGMRVSELLNLNVKDLQLSEGYGWVRAGKGGKDRVFIIAEKLRGNLEQWVNALDKEQFVFSNKGRKMSAQTVRAILKKATTLSGITKNIHPHTLRHSFSTHLLENGYAVTDLQPLLGHSKIETTLVYAHLARPKLLTAKSPYDSL